MVSDEQGTPRPPCIASHSTKATRRRSAAGFCDCSNTGSSAGYPRILSSRSWRVPRQGARKYTCGHASLRGGSEDDETRSGRRRIFQPLTPGDPQHHRRAAQSTSDKHPPPPTLLPPQPPSAINSSTAADTAEFAVSTRNTQPNVPTDAHGSAARAAAGAAEDRPVEVTTRRVRRGGLTALVGRSGPSPAPPLLPPHNRSNATPAARGPLEA